MKKNLEILQKNSEILFFFFPDQTPTRHQPHSQGLLPIQTGGQTWKIMISIEQKQKSRLGTKK